MADRKLHVMARLRKVRLSSDFLGLDFLSRTLLGTLTWDPGNLVNPQIITNFSLRIPLSSYCPSSYIVNIFASEHVSKKGARLH